jgi:methyltransferase-like protein
MQSSIGENKIENSTGQPMLISLQSNGRYNNNKQGNIMLADKGCLERVVHMQCRISIVYKMQSSIGEPMLIYLLTRGRYDKNKIETNTGQPMLLFLPRNWRYDKNKMLLR